MRVSLSSFFVLTGTPDLLRNDALHVLGVLAPHIHLTLLTISGELAPFQTHGPSRSIRLTQRETEILEWLALQKTNWEIARILGRSRNTVKHHVQHLFSKLEVAGRSEAISRGVVLGLLPERRNRRTPANSLHTSCGAI
jgi:DNA-binding CsgD family transcriptional regulator